MDPGDDNAPRLLLDGFAYDLRRFSLLAVEECVDRGPSTQTIIPPVLRLLFMLGTIGIIAGEK